jgi:sarcosine oxidase subunit alpha
VQQCHLPRLRTRFTSTTDAWAQFAIAGPRSRELLAGLLDAPLGAFPFLACAQVSVAGVPARLFRISFSGEHAYELAVSARHGESLWRMLVAQAEGLGGGPYGMEALNVLRIEKGFLTHAELHGRTTAFDLGLQGMLSTRKDFVGKAAATRPGLLEDSREQLVGLVPVSHGDRILAGAHLFDPGDKSVRVNDRGYVTSACHSPTLGHALGLGFLQNGRARHGAQVRMVDHLRGVVTLCTVTDPVFFDPEGARARG